MTLCEICPRFINAAVPVQFRKIQTTGYEMSEATVKGGMIFLAIFFFLELQRQRKTGKILSLFNNLRPEKSTAQ